MALIGTTEDTSLLKDLETTTADSVRASAVPHYYTANSDIASYLAANDPTVLHQNVSEGYTGITPYTSAMEVNSAGPGLGVVDSPSIYSTTDINGGIDITPKSQVGVDYTFNPETGMMEGKNEFGHIKAPSKGTQLGMNKGTAMAALGLGNLVLGYLNYKDTHAMNKQNLKASKQNLRLAEEDAANTRAYRASYGQ